MLNNKNGFALIMAMLSLLLVSIIGATGLTIVTTNLQTTSADERLNRAEKSANAGLLRAVDDVNRTGICTNQQIQGNLGNSQYTVNIKRSGRICFIKSEGVSGNARIIKTSIVQSFYGLGLYTVRGSVSANLGGSTVRLSGCDTTVTPTCFLPAFISSGSVSSTLPQRQCSQDTQGAGLYGNPAILSNVIFNDLIPLFFNVDCFNTQSSQNCAVGLLQIFENEYGRNPDPANANDPNRRYDMVFDNQWGIPRLNNNNIPSLPLTQPTIPGSCTTLDTITSLDLSNEYTGCNEIIIPPTGTNNLTISGNGSRGTQRVRIYDRRNAGTRTISNNTQNFILDIRTDGRDLTINNNANNFTVFNNGPTTITNASNFVAYTGTGGSTTIIGNGNNNSSNNFTLYTTGTTIYRSVNNGTVRDFRHRSTNNVTIDTNTTLQNGTIIIAQNNSQNINNLNNVNTSPFNLITNGTFTMRNMNLFVRSIRFANNTTVNILDSLIYLYAHACPNCSRADSNSSLTACTNNDLWCGWAGNSPDARFALNIGRGANNAQLPVLIISNNTTVYTNSLSQTPDSIWGAFVGEDVTYLRWANITSQNIRGFLIRNFPPNLTLNINISGNFTLDFRKSIIDQLSSRYWFLRKIDCIRDDMNPLTQVVQTGISAY